MFFDIIMSSSFIYNYGIGIELNPIIKSLYTNYSLVLGIWYIIAWSIQILLVYKFYNKSKIFTVTYNLLILLFCFINVIHIINYIICYIY